MVWSHHRRGGKTSPAKVKSKIDDIRFATVVASGTASLPLAYFNVVVISYYQGEVTGYETLQATMFEVASAFQAVCALMLIVAMLIILRTFRACFGTEMKTETNRIRLFLITFSIIFLV